MGAGSFKIYDSNEVSIVFAMIPIDGGFGEDEFCKISPAAESFVETVGVDGSVTRSKTNNRMAEVTITLMQTSDANDALSVLVNLDESLPGGAGVGPIMIRDKSGRALHVGAKAWIKKKPDRVFKKGAEGRQWTIQVANLVSFDGGS